MAWFTPDATSFFAELEQNNNREWFEKNKKRFETAVKRPMEELAAEMIERMRKLDPAITMLPKQAVFRIYRDTRFSADKRPYKTNAGMAISRGGKTDHTSPGLYFHLDAHCMAVASGFYFLEPPQIKSIREHIAANLEEFARLLNAAEFKSTFGTVAGEKNKLLPPELRAAATAQPLLYNKQFYFWAEHRPEEALREDLPEFLMGHLAAASPMNAFFSRALEP